MLKSKIINWVEPLIIARNIASNYQDNWVFLYSSLNQNIKNSKSLIALFPNQELLLDDFEQLPKYLKSSSGNYDQSWFGYFGYELNSGLEKLPKTGRSVIDLPKMWLINFGLIFEFDHQKKIVKAFFNYQDKLKEVLNYQENPQPRPKIAKEITVSNLKSNFSKNGYFKVVKRIKKMIANGDFYQTNITRKFYGKIDQYGDSDIKSPSLNQLNNFSLFEKLSKISPANYSAFLRLNNNYIISSSPESFLSIDSLGKVASKPIKGSAARSANPIQDQKNKENLRNNIKEQAENLMIVDLVRNDLSKNCKISSIKVKNLFEITSYKTIHHMSSEIHGVIDRKQNFDNFDVVKSCFPPGSMTGAPKVKAMEMAALEEKINRGVYSGAIGYLSKNHHTELSVVIRTLIIKDNLFEFQVGGAITHDSEIKNEWLETISKAKAISKLLKIKISTLKKL
jgi:para-aminobenzoate synthetase component 1